MSGWENVREFTVGSVELPDTPQAEEDRVGPRIERPGQVDGIGRTEWLSGDAKQLAEKAAGRPFTGVLDALTPFGAEGGDQPAKERVLEWRAGEDVVMLSEATKSIKIKALWLDAASPSPTPS